MTINPSGLRVAPANFVAVADSTPRCAKGDAIFCLRELPCCTEIHSAAPSSPVFCASLPIDPSEMRYPDLGSVLQRQQGGWFLVRSRVS